MNRMEVNLPKRIGFVYDGTAFGGVEIHLMLLLRYLDKTRYEPFVIISGYSYQFVPKQFIEQLQLMNIPLLTSATPYKYRSLSFIKDILTLWRLFRSARLDLIHIHTSRLDGARRPILGYFLARGKKIIRSEHVPPSANIQPHSRYLIKPFDWLTNKIVVGSVTCKDEQINLLNRNPAKIHLSYYGIELDGFNYPQNIVEAKRRLNLDPALPVVGIVARLSKEKGHTYFVEAAARVLKEYGPANFMIVGNGPLEEALREQVVALGIEKYVHFMGFVKATKPFIEAMDITTLSSLNEGISLAMLEYMAMGKAIVATDEPSFEETIVDGESGLIVSRENSKALADGIIQLLREPALGKMLGKNAYERVHCQFDIKYQVADLMDLYDEVLGQKVTEVELEDQDSLIKPA